MTRRALLCGVAVGALLLGCRDEGARADPGTEAPPPMRIVDNGEVGLMVETRLPELTLLDAKAADALIPGALLGAQQDATCYAVAFSEPSNKRGRKDVVPQTKKRLALDEMAVRYEQALPYGRQSSHVIEVGGKRDGKRWDARAVVVVNYGRAYEIIAWSGHDISTMRRRCMDTLLARFAVYDPDL